METINTQLQAPHDVGRRLERLRNYSTRWELVAAGPDDGHAIRRAYLVAYIAGKSRNKILDNLQAVGERLFELTNTVSLDWNTKQKAWTSDTGWTFGIGRTQRDAITNGEYQPIRED